MKESVLSERGMRVHTTWKQIQRTKEGERERERETERERNRERQRQSDSQKERDRDRKTERQDIKRETGRCKGCLQRWCIIAGAGT